MFTDYLLMAELLIISVLLLRSRNVVTWDPVLGRNVVARGSWRDSPRRNQFWAAGCFLLALSFAAGGTEHGFALYLKCDGRDQCIGSSWVWVATLLLQTPGLALPVVGTAHLVLSRESCWVRVAQAYGAAIVVVFSALVVFFAYRVSGHGDVSCGPMRHVAHPDARLRRVGRCELELRLLRRRLFFLHVYFLVLFVVHRTSFRTFHQHFLDRRRRHWQIGPGCMRRDCLGA